MAVNRVPRERKFKKKPCLFCIDKTGTTRVIDYKDTGLLRKFVSDRGKIRPRRVSGNCRQHQRDVAVAIKNAREVALLPYSSSGGEKPGPSKRTGPSIDTAPRRQRTAEDPRTPEAVPTATDRPPPARRSASG
jgi:small subunit ribosomal protein S18